MSVPLTVGDHILKQVADFWIDKLMLMLNREKKPDLNNLVTTTTTTTLLPTEQLVFPCAQ